MKKITLLSLMFAGVATFAQQVQQDFSLGSLQNGLQATNRTATPLNPNERNKHALQAGVFHYMLIWQDAKSQYEITINNTPATNYQWYTNPIFMDSTGRQSSSTTTDEIFNMRAGVVVDPWSPYFDPNQGDVPLLTSSDAYVVDTVIIDAFYQRRVNINDTLVVELSWADTGATTTAWTQIYNGTKNQWWICPKLNSSAAHGNVSHLTAPVANRLRINRVLTAADTVTVNNPWAGWIVVVVPGGLKIPAKNPVAVTYTFAPGSYNEGDVVFQYSGPMTPATKNGIGGALRGQKDYAGTNGQSYWYDRSTIGTNPAKTKNVSLDYYTNGRYGKYTGGQAFANTAMYPGANFCWDIGIMISNQPVGIKVQQPNSLRIGQNVPNPFSDITFISYELTENTNVMLEIFDITGKKVQAIEEGKKFAGSHSIQFNGSNLQAGVYFYTLTAGENRVTKRMTLVK